MSSSEYSPIALFVYNRPEILVRVLSHLKNNPEITNSVLYVFSDGPKTVDDAVNVERVRAIISGISFCKEVKSINSDINLGLAKSILSGVTSLLKDHNSVIVLEDDLLVSRGFLKYMNESLKVYCDKNDVISISGYFYAIDAKLPETFFISGAESWGWATWQRGWHLLETDPEKLLLELRSRELTNEFDFGGNYPFTKMLEDQAERKNFSWAVQWHASAFLKNKFTLFPYRSLVEHVGVNGTNYTNDPFLDKVNRVEKIQVIPIAVRENNEARKAIISFFAQRKKYIESKKLSFLGRIISLFN